MSVPFGVPGGHREGTIPGSAGVGATPAFMRGQTRPVCTLTGATLRADGITLGRLIWDPVLRWTSQIAPVLLSDSSEEKLASSHTVLFALYFRHVAEESPGTMSHGSVWAVLQSWPCVLLSSSSSTSSSTSFQQPPRDLRGTVGGATQDAGPEVTSQVWTPYSPFGSSTLPT